MASPWTLIGRSFDRGERVRLGGFFGAVGALHLVGWGLLLAYGAQHPGFLALGGLAYTFGLRHAFDAFREVPFVTPHAPRLPLADPVRPRGRRRAR